MGPPTDPRALGQCQMFPNGQSAPGYKHGSQRQRHDGTNSWRATVAHCCPR
ncbi:unnamed protein product, partial [Staurois parvus]